MTEPSEIYLFRRGEKQGPYDQPTIDRMLLEGTVQLTDSAWRTGLPDWTTLSRALEREVPAPTDDGPTHGSASGMVIPSEPATGKQKAFLSYMGISFKSGISKARAALLVNEAMENPSDPARLAKWPEDRLRLHPELFASDLQARKENRPSYFHEQVEKEGAEVFHDVGKAHCQVLVGYLDVKYPNWDARDGDPVWDYFFPAIAEKFPQLVQKGWKNRLKYAQGPRIAADMVRSTPNVTMVQRRAPIFSGGALAWMFILALAAGGGWYAYQHGLLKLPANGAGGGQAVGNSTKRPEPSVVLVAKSTHATGATGTAAPAPAKAGEVPFAPPPTPPAVAQAPAMSGNPPPATDSAPMTGGAPAADTAPMAGAPLTAETPPMAGAPAAETPPMAGGAPLFTPPAAPPATAPVAVSPGVVPTPTPAARSTVVLTKPVTVQTTYGKVTIAAGTTLKIVGPQEANVVKVAYMNNIVALPVQLTNLAP